MKKKILKYHLEIFTAFVLLFIIVNAILFRHLSDVQRIINLFLLLGVLHEWEEKRYPGGFFELMQKKLKLDFCQEIVDKAGCIVVAYWLLITLIPFAFDRLMVLFLIPVALNFFEAFIHTMGIVIHQMKKPYTPGMVSGWIMAAASAVVVVYLGKNALASASDYIFGVILFFGTFLLMDIAIFKAAGMSVADMKRKITDIRKK